MEDDLFGLNDVAEGDLFDRALIDDAAVFAKISAEIQSKIAHQRLTRREWLALCTSYFGLVSDAPEENPQWLQLRMQIVSGFKQLKRVRLARCHGWRSSIPTVIFLPTMRVFCLGNSSAVGK